MTVAEFKAFLLRENLVPDYRGDERIEYGKDYYLVGRLTGRTLGTFHVDGAPAWVHVRLF